MDEIAGSANKSTCPHCGKSLAEAPKKMPPAMLKSAFIPKGMAASSKVKR